MHDTIQKLKELLVTKLKLKIGVDQIKEDTLLFGSNSLGLDSIDVLELIIAIKKEFGVEIMDRETSEQVFTSVGAIARYIDKNK
ncbi:acyl carrier protein [Candidatus Kuenenia stuttgartiensis]|jgi:acyl carrier protein|uniref:Acyl carrier protein n=1 Tax=Kuenenia stuttgartiensis TaxID=174633 RepID=Q1Q262_KUEST|nr:MULTISPECIES: phosphopantetheine-binding protein [Kuenenia]MBE7548738.1 acyl carrier protein [Planctomycetia bacterium]MBW7941571.1 acyl carrier protein [Candidatus Kuenenia stuttgartiensis]MCF6150908.1 acyl carrier protein [Candidatus Kuenenia stuttgartiensis]MCZ7622241.1 phosphopantetheine-binding protein [Candidatus Kuenenia sp.]QII11131.1 acyl carrier protein [Candidatus Kuenenia stuttgartiensis]